MRIGIDMLGNQTTSRTRGIGRYTRNLVANLLARHPQHEYFLYYHPGLPGMEDLWPGSPVRVCLPWAAFGPNRCLSAEPLARTNPDRLDVLLLTTAFEYLEGYLPPPKPPGTLKMAVVMYDLIPWLFPEAYLRDEATATSYHRAACAIRQYDLLLAISEASRGDCLNRMGLPPERVVNIRAASDEFFYPLESPEPIPEALAVRGLTRPFVFCLSGMDSRKNLEGLIAAFSRLPDELRRNHDLVVTCVMTDDEQRNARRLAQEQGIGDQLVLTNFVGDETVRALYQQCAAFAFPSRYEGFGLPILEALQCGAPVLAGHNSSQSEVVGQAGLLVNVDDPIEMAAGLARLLSDRALAKSLRSLGPEQARTFTWASTADKAAAALETLAPAAVIRPAKRSPATAKTRIAFFSPLPPIRSGISDYSDRLLSALARHYAIDVYHDCGYMPYLQLASAEFACRDYRLFPRYQKAVDYRAIVYQMGNSEYHGFVYQSLLRYPGLVVLHDVFLANFHLWYSNHTGAAEDHFAREFAGAAPSLAGEIDTVCRNWSSEPGGLIGACARRGLMLNRGILERATAVAVHDAWALQSIRRMDPSLARKVTVIPQGAQRHQVDPGRGRQIRDQHRLAPDALIIGSFGILHPQKGNLQTIEAFAALAHEFPQAILIFVGRDLGEGQTRDRASALGLGGRVRFFGHLPLETYMDLASVTDIGVNLRRPPTNGETSAALLNLLGAGVSTVITDVDAFTSFPDHIVAKVRWGDMAAGGLMRALRALASDPASRRRMGQAAADYVHQVHAWPRVAALYADWIEGSLERPLGAPGGLAVVTADAAAA